MLFLFNTCELRYQDTPPCSTRTRLDLDAFSRGRLKTLKLMKKKKRKKILKTNSQTWMTILYEKRIDTSARHAAPGLNNKGDVVLFWEDKSLELALLVTRSIRRV